MLEVIHRYVELLDKYFESVRLRICMSSFAGRVLMYAAQVCELDIIFNFEKVLCDAVWFEVRFVKPVCLRRHTSSWMSS